VRGDLPTGLKVANAVHAAGESSDRVPKGTIAVALEVGSEIELRGLSHRLTLAGIAHVTIVESEGLYAGQAMAIGIEPTEDRLSVRRLTSHLRCVK
jgi:hypothetical protein